MTQVNFNLDLEEMTEELLDSNLNNVLKAKMIMILNEYMEEERDSFVNANPKQKTSKRQSVRNGYYERELIMPVGKINLRVPRTRDGEFSTEVFERYSRMDQALVLMMMEAVIGGVSTRKVSRLVEAIAGKKVSKSFVSNIMKRLDPMIREWSQRTLTTHTYKYLYVDAMYIKVRENNKVVSKAVYIAQAVNELDKRELVGFKVSEKESHKAWSEFFEDLRTRGFTNPKLIISDAHKGLRSAISEEFLDVPWQRCTVHFLRNIVTNMPKKDSYHARRLLRSIFKAPTIQHAKELKEAFLTEVEGNSKYDNAVSILEEGFDDATQFYRFPEAHHAHIRTTNSIENINMQIRRREKVIRIFPNNQSAFRLVGAVLLDLSDELDINKTFLR